MTSTDLHEFLRTRRSIRRFKTDPIPDSVLQEIITTATFAPSAHNRQPWRFVILRTLQAKTCLAEAMAMDFRRDLEKDKVPEIEINRLTNRSRERIISAPAVVVICADSSEMDVYPDPKRKKAEYIMAVQSVANAGMQLLLAIHAEGLGAVWTCSPLFAPDTVQNALDISKTWEPQAMFLIGYADELPKSKVMKEVQSLVKIL